MARSSECTGQYVQKVLDSADIVRDGMLRQLSDFSADWEKPQAAVSK
jgi:hypothetical protein